MLHQWNNVPNIRLMFLGTTLSSFLISTNLGILFPGEQKDAKT